MKLFVNDRDGCHENDNVDTNSGCDNGSGDVIDTGQTSRDCDVGVQTSGHDRNNAKKIDMSTRNSDDVRQSQNNNSSQWYDAEKLTGVKMFRGKRHYRVVWKDRAFPPSWINEDDVSEALKRAYHIKRTKTGLLRKEYKKKRGRNGD